MEYILKQYDTPLLKFSADIDTAMPEIDITWVNEEKKALLPLNMDISPDGLIAWIRHRTIPKNRAYVHALLAKSGISPNRPLAILSVCKGLSLNDSYWVVEKGFEGSFEHNNLYDNRFNRVLGLIAFTGYGSSLRSSLASSPEYTTNGMLPKCWRRINGQILLYKGGTSGASNTGFEPYSEFYAAQIAERMGIDAVSYNLSKWKGQLCSTCNLFTSKTVAFMPIGRLVSRGGLEAVKEYYSGLGPQYLQSLADMLVFDAIVCNTDRHFGNFGVLINSITNQISAPAPLFDHGNSLFNYAGKEYKESSETLQTYIDTLEPCAYSDFLGTARNCMTARNHEQLRHLLNFSFQRHNTYNLPQRELRLIEAQVQKRARLLLEM